MVPLSIRKNSSSTSGFKRLYKPEHTFHHSTAYMDYNFSFLKSLICLFILIILAYFSVAAEGNVQCALQAHDRDAL